MKMKEIKLTREMVALVDDSDFDWLNSFKWFAIKGYKTFYAVRNASRKINNGKQTLICMHREILKLTNPKVLVDHKDRNGLNNQRYNLRTASHSQNLANRSSKENSSSKHLGVCWDKTHRLWRAIICKNQVIKRLGYFKNEADAAIAYNNAAKIIHGEFANTNIL